MKKSHITIYTCSLEKRGRRWPHRHKWVPCREHPRFGDVSVTFMLEDDEPDMIEMCLTCPARRMKGTESKKATSKKVTVGDIVTDTAIGLVVIAIVGLVVAAGYVFYCLGNL